VDILQRDGIQIARRTVAKYREQLGVLSARMRKRV
jgi:RNA polymerase sigma-54 factor